MKLKLLPFALCFLPFAVNACPFDTDAECEIWRAKPAARQIVSPRAAKIADDDMGAFVAAVCSNPDIGATAAVAEPFLERYKILMKSAQSCCGDGMAYQLKHGGASDAHVYKFLSDDANFYNVIGGCLMMTNADIQKTIPGAGTAVADVRDECLCKSRDFFKNLLAPFSDAFAAAPKFADARFEYNYRDGVNNIVSVSINRDVKNVLDRLAKCPK